MGTKYIAPDAAQEKTQARPDILTPQICEGLDHISAYARNLWQAAHAAEAGTGDIPQYPAVLEHAGYKITQEFLVSPKEGAILIRIYIRGGASTVVLDGYIRDGDDPTELYYCSYADGSMSSIAKPSALFDRLDTGWHVTTAPYLADSSVEYYQARLGDALSRYPDMMDPSQSRVLKTASLRSNPGMMSISE